METARRTNQKSNPSQQSKKQPERKMSQKDSKFCPDNEIKTFATKKQIHRSNLVVPDGYCRDFCRRSCPRGTTCKWKHDEAVKKTFIEKRAIVAKPMLPHANAQVTLRSISKASTSNMPLKSTPRLESLSTRRLEPYPTPPATPEVAKSEHKPTASNKSLNIPKLNRPRRDDGKFKDQRLNSQKLNGQRPNNHQKFSCQKPDGSDPTPPSSPQWGVSDAGWHADPAELALWKAASDEAAWADNRARSPVDDITTRVFSKICAEVVKLPHLTTKTRKSRNRKVHPLWECVRDALIFAQKRESACGSDMLDPDINGDTSVLVKAAEGYKNALRAGKISDVLKRSEHAHLDVIIASQHWDEGSATKKVPPALPVSRASEYTTCSPSSSNSPQKPKTKPWEQSDYWAWAKRNLTDETAIKLARTYCQSLENGVEPKKLFSGMGKQAPPGTAFRYFSLLPYELREQIWLEVLRVERNDVRLVWMHDTAANGHPTNTRFVNANQQQRLLFVNHELRGLALKHNYELAFGTKHSRAATYFDFARDRLFLHTRHANELADLVRYLHPRERERVRVLAVPLRDLVTGDERRVAEALCKFPCARKIHLVCGDGLEDRTYGGAGDPGLARAIERLVHDSWRRCNGPSARRPSVRMYTIPALAARYFSIDDMVNGMNYG